MLIILVSKKLFFPIKKNAKIQLIRIIREKKVENRIIEKSKNASTI